MILSIKFKSVIKFLGHFQFAAKMMDRVLLQIKKFANFVAMLECRHLSPTPVYKVIMLS